MSERKGTKALELWCKRLIKDCPDIHIENMTTSWRNGMAFCALVHHFRPDLIDMSKLKPENIYENNQLAFNIAEKYLGIPALLDPEDMVDNDVPDRLSILTYLSQFYQRLSHTVNTKVSENESKALPTKTTEPHTPVRFGKTGLDKCTSCGLPVYLAQRLMVAHKLYHRRCFRCSKCSGHLNPKSYETVEGSDFTCDSCKNDKTLSKLLNNNNDQNLMGMLAFTDVLDEPKPKDNLCEDKISFRENKRPQSVLDKISMFEKNIEKDVPIDNRMNNILKENSTQKNIEVKTEILNEHDPKTVLDRTESSNKPINNLPDVVYKSNVKKFNFLQTQLSDGTCNESTVEEKTLPKSEHKLQEDVSIDVKSFNKDVFLENSEPLIVNDYNNITDDSRLANSVNVTLSSTEPISEEPIVLEPEIKINVPPRRKKQMGQDFKKISKPKGAPNVTPQENEEYPDHLNPFSDDDDDEVQVSQNPSKTVSTNPFGSSDDENEELPPIPPISKQPETLPVKRLIAVNPFWSDGEEPSTDDEIDDLSSKMYNSSMATSTPNLPSSAPRRKKQKAPPPPVVLVSEPQQPGTSMEDVASLSSHSSYNSTANSSHMYGKSTPVQLRKNITAPTPPDSISTLSECAGSLEKGVDTSGLGSNNSSLVGRRTKGPAPGLPLPERREVKLQMSPEELQVQLDLLETQQLGLERQGVLIEKMIRDKCEGDEPSSVPQEEVEDLVIQLCELVNEKNDLFRKQTELMYIRRQQRLEQEQADIEHEIRIIQSRPAVNRIDADKAREEELVTRLVEIVRLRDELVQQLDAERRREQQEDLAIAASIASKRAQRQSESNSSSIKSVEVAAPKKNKVKDKMKKQFKKAKHTLISKKKDDSPEHKEEKERKKSK